MRFAHVPAFVALLGAAACSTTAERTSFAPRTGPWRLDLDLKGELLPVVFDLDHDSSGWSMVVHNGEERILIRDIELHNDTLHVRMPLYDSEFRGIVKNDSLIAGAWHNYLKGPDYQIPFVAHAGLRPRFDGDTSAAISVNGIWETHFSSGTNDAYDALGIFTQHGAHVSGTFGTETGDYRFLDGIATGDSMKLSCFDGSHAFLFTAALRHDSLVGRYWSGIHWQEPWVAVRNPDYRLRDPDSLTFLREGYTMADFSFPSIDGPMVSVKDSAHAGKVLMVQIMGSWCPNCVDETRLLDEMYAEYRDRGLGVIAVAFEKYDDPKKAVSQLKRFRDNLEVKYDIVYAGHANKEEASAKLPFLDHVMSYPTCIFIDRKGLVRRIRTGFYGPGTGDHYTNYRRNLRSFLEQLLAEPGP